MEALSVRAGKRRADCTFFAYPNGCQVAPSDGLPSVLAIRDPSQHRPRRLVLRPGGRRGL